MIQLIRPVDLAPTRRGSWSICTGPFTRISIIAVMSAPQGRRPAMGSAATPSAEPSPTFTIHQSLSPVHLAQSAGSLEEPASYVRSHWDVDSSPPDLSHLALVRGRLPLWPSP